MAYNQTVIGAMRIANPKEWERKIREAMNAHHGCIPDAAKSLGIGIRQLARWLGEFPDIERATSSTNTLGESRRSHSSTRLRTKKVASSSTDIFGRKV